LVKLGRKGFKSLQSQQKSPNIGKIGEKPTKVGRISGKSQ
jgi:hypothetical protein